MCHRSPIELLPGPVIEKIAAGEVIERPASVLKELVENAIDAGATAIDVVVENAGFSLLKLTDNGGGMDRADLDKCLLRHATSKIRTADDLFTVTSLGFRGEALASITAVSRMSVASCSDRNGLGYRITSQGGERGKSEPVSHGRGTTIEVRDLFFNVPARKKFMKGQRSEQMALVRVFEQLAIPFPSIHFTLTVDNSSYFDLEPVPSPRARIGAIAGMEYARDLIECRNSPDDRGIDLVCFVSSPEKQEKRPRFQSLYVNLRRVECDSITFAIRQAFNRYLSSAFRPSFFCFIAIDPSRVDVNVHPTKQEIKFDNDRAAASTVFSVVETGIGARLTARSDLDMKAASSAADAQKAAQFKARDYDRTRHIQDGDTVMRQEGQEQHVEEQTIIPFPTLPKINVKEVDPSQSNGIQLSSDQEERLSAWDLISCYQIHDTYILAPIKNGILLIDQHAAHERVLFEGALQDMARGRSSSQQLLFPVVVELTMLEKEVVLSGVSCFAAFGFEVSDFGGASVSVSAIPFFMGAGEVEGTLREMVRYLLDEGERHALRDTEKRFAAAFACGAAIKAGKKLTQEEMNALVNSLFAAENPYTCPHGRPTLVRISLEELERRFLR